MKRVAEKVRDIVEVRPFMHLHDFSADPGLTLGGYHFTDITADLMGKWIQRISEVKPGHGAALALAGFRGVGKSHFLAVIGSIVARPELRSKITDSYVSTCADRLSRRHGSVVMVRRGSGTSLVDEFRRAVGEMLGVKPGTLPDSPYDLLLNASEYTGEARLIVLIDTALGRESRVSRDDGAIISEIAEAAQPLGIFVGAALDDDISGADGPNSSISSSFAIDYLDQEHLYKIVEAHIFAKNSQQLPLLREIYEYYREVMPGFRWSEQRFTSLYPLHPATVEIAPLIRLYIQDFALLGFASEAGVKILGRPANSLIGLDEVYDSVETKLRAVSELKDAFASFDDLEQSVISKLPVQQRLQAKLILKGLLILSLNGAGTTAAEIAASMMIYDEQHAGSTSIDVGKLLDSFAEGLPGAVDRTERDGVGTKYCFKLAAKEEVDDVLGNAITGVSDEMVWNVLLRQTAEKYSDLDIPSDFRPCSTSCTVSWRGGSRRGEIVWNSGTEAKHRRESIDGPDWIVSVARSRIESEKVSDKSTDSHIEWRLAEPADDEKDTIRRYHLLQNDPTLRQKLGDGFGTATHVHTIAVEKIWQRLFLHDGVLVTGGVEHAFTEEARSAHSLAQMFGLMLSPVFDAKYPDHPDFVQPLNFKNASALITSFFGGGAVNDIDVQKLAETLAVPLGLAVRQGDIYVPAVGEILSGLPLVVHAFDGVVADKDNVFPLTEINFRLRTPPFGLTREAQHLILSALVSQRQFEFVTSSGNRINHRSLDLQIIWDDLVGIAPPLNGLFAPERLLTWAKLTTGNFGIRSLDRAEDRLLIIDSLTGWLAGWNESRVLADFEALPDENLNALIWRTATNLKKSFGAMAAAIEPVVKDKFALDQCLHSIAELFSDSEAEFEKKKTDLRVLGEFTKSVSRRGAISSYMSLCEITGDADVESARNAILKAVDATIFWSNAGKIDEVEKLWHSFHSGYSAYYIEKHNAELGRGAAAEMLREILGSSSWSACENLYRISWLDQRFITRSRSLIREIRQQICNASVKDALVQKPFCTCSFSLNDDARQSDLPAQLRSTIDHGLAAIDAQLKANRGALSDAADSDVMRSSLVRIFDGIDDFRGLASLSGQDIRLLRHAADRVNGAGLVGHAVEISSADEPFDLLSGNAPSLGYKDDPLEILTNQ